MRIAAARKTVFTSIVVFGMLSIGFGALTVDAFATGQYLAAIGMLVLGILGAFAAQRVYRAELYADESWVGRTAPWPQRCRRTELGAIRYAGPFVSPAWEFVKSDGEVAFRVSPFMFKREPVEQLATFLGLSPPVRSG